MKSTLFLSFLLFCTVVFSQNTVSLKVPTLSVHPLADANLILHKHTLGSSGVATFEPGILFEYDTEISKILTFHISTAVLADRFSGMSGFVQAGINLRLFRINRHSAYLVAGPAVFMTGSRETIPEYINEESYKQGNFVPNYKLSLMSGALEYEYILNKEMALSLAMLHSQPQSLAFAIGVRFRKVGSGKGCNCPSYR